LTAAYLGLPTKLPFCITLDSGLFEFDEWYDIPTFWQIFFADIYPVQQTDKTIIDAGANIGAFTLYALLRAPECRVIAVEPAPDTCGRLRAALFDHRLERRCIVYQAALADRVGVTTISLTPYSQFRSTGHGEVAVPTTTLDEIVDRCEQVDLLKMDIEGAEYSVLGSARWATLQHVQRISLEYHPSGKPEAILRHLQECGFVLDRFHEAGEGYGTALLSRPVAAHHPVSVARAAA
jgi:FkbM family methyltransferase